MPISNFVPRNMRMNVSQFFMYNLGLKNCDYSDKQEIKEISKDSMQCCMNNIKETEVEKFKKEELIKTEKLKSEEPILIINPIEIVPKLPLNFIPHPDHNYGQLPPRTPPEEEPKVEEAKNEESPQIDKPLFLSDQNSTENKEEQEGVTRCICGFEHDDGYMICCDNCSSWQHIECMGIKSSKVPEKYSCHNCSPRELDIEGAKAIQEKKKENMSEEDDDEDEETCSEDESSSKTMYTAISNTPTRITLLSNTSQQSTQGTLKNKNRKGNKVPKKKLSDQRNTRRKTKKKDKNDFPGNDINGDNILFPDSNSLNDFISAHKLYEEIEENKYDEEFKNMHFKLPEAVPSIDFKNIVKCHQVLDVSRNRKGLIALFDIQCGNFILEYKGTLMSRKKFEDCCSPIFKNSCPYVVNYTKIDHLFLVIDARDYGNDARFVRRSCTPNAELQHITSNGALHIMIISKVDILQDKEITVPFDFHLDFYKGHLECACNLEGCTVKKQNEELKQANKIINNTDLINNLIPPPPIPNENNPIKTESPDETVESESESNIPGEESKEKLSREERKLQAYMKQFEKLEKKQDTCKKVKEIKTPLLKVTPDENSLTATPVIRPTVSKKVAGGKRKICFTAKRRTRQSSCSSEPVSPTEQDVISCVSTPTTPVVSTIITPMQLEATHMTSRQRFRNQKEPPLMLTLPIQRKLKQDHPVDNPVPQLAQFIPPMVSPTRPGDQQSSLSLSVETELENTPIKTSNLNGLLQIVQTPKTPVVVSNTSSLGVSTCEEKIGDISARIGETQPTTPPVKPTPSFQREGNLQRRYFGSIKKHWLRQYTQSNSNSLNIQLNGLKQISLAALVASLSLQHLSSSTLPNPVFKRSQNHLPLKRRHLLRASKYKQIIQSSLNTSPTSFSKCFNAALFSTRNNDTKETYTSEAIPISDVINNVETSIALTCGNFDNNITSSNTYVSNMPMQERTSIQNKIGGIPDIPGSNTKLTDLLIPLVDFETNNTSTTAISLNSEMSDTSSVIIKNDSKTDVTSIPPCINPNLLHSVDSETKSKIGPSVTTMALINSDFTNVRVQSGIDTKNEGLCSVMETNSEFQSGIEISTGIVLNPGGETNTDSYPDMGIKDTQSLSSVETLLSQNISDIKTTTSEICSVIKTTCSEIETANTQIQCGIQRTYPESICVITTTNQQLQSVCTDTKILEPNLGLITIHNSEEENTLQNNLLCQHSSVDSSDKDGDSDEPSCKKQRLDVSEESGSDIGLKIVISEPTNTSDTSFSSSSENSSLLISAQNDFRIQNTRPNSLGNVSLSINPKYITTSPRNSMDSNLDTDSNSSITQGEAGTGGKKKLSFKEYRSRRSQKNPASNINHLTISSEHLPPMPVSPAQKINQAAGLLLTPRTVSLRNFERTAGLYTNNLETYLPVSTPTSLECNISVMVSNGISPPLPLDTIITDDPMNLSPEQIQDGEIIIESSNIQRNNIIIESGMKHPSDLAYGSNTTFEPVSPGNEYDSGSPVDDSVGYLNTIHSDITKNPFSIHNDITKHPFGKKQNQGQSPLQYLSTQKYPHASSSPVGSESTLPRAYQIHSTDSRGSDVTEIDDDASSTHSNMSSTSYGSVSEVAHERSYPPTHHRSYPREHSSREYSSRDPPRDSREYYPSSPHPAFGAPPSYYQNYNQPIQQPITRSSGIQRIPGFSPHNSYPLSSNQTPRQRQTHRGYIPF